MVDNASSIKRIQFTIDPDKRKCIVKRKLKSAEKFRALRYVCVWGAGGGGCV